MSTVSIKDDWDHNLEFVDITESKKDDSEVDGEHIIARVMGPAFFPGRTSGNNVYYDPDVWNDVLNDSRLIKRLDTRMVYGTIGHDVKMDDEAVRNGLASHIVSKMWIDEDSGVGMAEYLILGTPVGKILNTILRAKSKLRVSTKAKGQLTPPNNKGVRSLAKGRYNFERIDFVTVPGFEDAEPDIVESLNQALHLNINEQEDPQMDELVKLLQAQMQTLNESLTASNVDKARFEEQLKTVNESLASITSKNDASQTALAAYTALGSVESIQESLNSLAAYTELGTAAEINESLDAASTRIGYLNTIIEESSREVNESLMADENINEELEQYKALGTVAEIQELVNVVESLNQTKIEETLTSLSEKYSVTRSIAESLYKALDDFEKVEEALQEQQELASKNVNESRKTSSKSFQSPVNTDVNIDESKSIVSTVGLSRKLMNIK